MAVTERRYCFGRAEMLMHHEESFDTVSCRGMGEAQGELFNSVFHETQRSAGSAFIGVSSFNMRMMNLRDSPQRYRMLAAISLSWLQAGMSLCHFIASYQ
jgi:hypothetical protein